MFSICRAQLGLSQQQHKKTTTPYASQDGGTVSGVTGTRSTKAPDGMGAPMLAAHCLLMGCQSSASRSAVPASQRQQRTAHLADTGSCSLYTSADTLSSACRTLSSGKVDRTEGKGV